MRPDERIAEIFARRVDGEQELGSGYLVTPRLVLTAAHVVCAGGAPAAEVNVRFLGDRATVPGRVAWCRHDDVVDAAMIEITGEAGRVPAAPPVRWGRLTGARGGVPCEATGFPEAQRGPYGMRDTEQLSGTINPGTRAKARRHDVLAGDWPERRAGSGWRGISGAAVFCGDLLTGVIVEDPPEFASRRLTAVPVTEFLGDPEFIALAGRQTAESVELARLFQRETPASVAPSPADMLRAEAEIVPFHGRAELLAELSAWSGDRDVVSAWLVIGPGGQGKTRLAREFAARQQAAGWAVGWLRPDDGQPPDFDVLADSTVPVLMIVDYAETRTGQVERLISRVAAAQRSGLRVRLLLLARSSGAWWRQLVISSPAVEQALTRHIAELPPLEDTAAGRAALFATAAEHFARALRDRGQAPPGPPPEPPHDLGDSRYGSVLTVHMAALAALLQAGPEPVAAEKGEGVEEVLLRHEERYWEKTARARGLRFVYSKALSRAVSVATLFSPATETEAARLLGTVPGLRDQPEERRLALAEWLRDLYPAADGDYWGRLQPDRLGEHLVARVSADGADLFDGLFADAVVQDTQRGFEVLSRAAALQPAAADAIARLVFAKPELAPVAVVAATRSEHPEPLVKAIEPLADRAIDEPPWLDELIAVTWATPQLFGAWNVTVFRKLVARYRELHREDPATHGESGLAARLSSLAERLNAVGDAKEARETLEEAVELWRALTPGSDKELAAALGLLAGLYSRLGRTTKAVRLGKESVRLWERRDPPDPHGTVQSLSNLSKYLKDAGDPAESLKAAQRALDIYHKVPEPDSWLTIIATSAGTNKANRLLDFGESEAGLTILREVVSTRRRIVEDLPLIFDNDHASGLHNLAKTLSRMGRREEAVPHIEEAVSIYRRLTVRLPAIYMRDLADTLDTRGILLLGIPGRILAGVESLVEAERIATAINDRALLLQAMAGLRHARRLRPDVRRHIGELRRQWARADSADQRGESPADHPDSVRMVRHQPRRLSRQDRKKKFRSG